MEGKLKLLYPPFREQVEDFLYKCEQKGLVGGVFEGFRSYADQDKAYAQGRTVMRDQKGNKLPIITRAKAGTSLHNFGLAIDPENPAGKITAEINDKLTYQPWSEENSPIVLKVPARRIKEWKATIQNTVDAVREGPVKSDEPTVTIEMIPMGCAHLRMSVLPVVNDRKDARYWEDIPNPDLFMLDRLDK